MNKSKQTVVALSVCTALVGAVGVAQADSSQSPFAMQKLSSGYMVAAGHMEGKCGEGKCGGKKEAEGKCGEGKCGGTKKGHSEGKCGEGKCGMSMMDGNGDGNVSKAEFMSSHEKMFSDKDKNNDGVLDAGEMKMMEGKCGEGKCGGK